MSIQVSTANDVKVYNISTGKSLPEWISERKRRSLLKNDEDLRRRIELIQDFKMPTATNVVTLTPDSQYIFAAGVYKPRVRCYDTSQLSMKFERCIDNEVVAMTILSEDYSKFVLLESNRTLEFHVQHGFYYSTRIPTFGRGMAYHSPSCDLYIAASGSDIYRLNLEHGTFLSSMTTTGSGSNAITICKEHQLIAVGTETGRIECFDPRSRSRVGLLTATDDNSSVTAVQFNNALTLGVGTEGGVVKLYDLRSRTPFAVKEHHYQLPVHSMYFQPHENLVLSADRKAVRIWDSNDCTPFSSIEPYYDINSMCPVSGSGLIFLATEHSQVLSYFIPSLGPAPKWCSFLDSLTEELEESPNSDIYDDYKFVTPKDLEELGLSHLVGTNLLRAYMHGYFMDVRLYHKARAVAQPFAYEEYRKNKIREKIEEERQNRVQKKALPKVNRELARKLMSTDEEKKKGKGKKTDANPLTDDRFSALFSNPDFQVDTNSEEYKLLNPILSQAMKLQDKTLKEEEEEEEEEEEGEYEEALSSFYSPRQPEPVISIIKGDVQKGSGQLSRLILGERLLDSEGQDKQEVNTTTTGVNGSASIGGGLTSTFTIRKESAVRQKEVSLLHRRERKSLRRPASGIIPKRKRQGVYWRGKRVK